MMATHRVTLELTSEQEETIKALFGHNNWDYIKIESPKAKRQRKSKRQETEDEPRNGHIGDNHEEEVEEGVVLNYGECEHCFQAPCVTSRNFLWIGNGQAPCNENSAIRRAKYTHYRKIISNLGGWNDPRYLRVKQARANGGEWAIHHRREVLPKCVLTQMRTFYPNPKGAPYMDHKWE